MSFTLHRKCRACGSTELEDVFDLGLQPLSNEFRKANEPRSGFFPLSVILCPRCTLSQLSIVVNPETLYRDYKYVTSSSQIMRRHFERLFQDLASEGAIGTIVEIGSNDGKCLKCAKDKGYRVMGIEPARNLVEISENTNGVECCRDFFTEQSARLVKSDVGSPSVILARHCFGHVDNWQEFLAGLEVLAGPQTIIALEVPYVHDTLSKVEFDTLYHEHLSCISLTAIYYLIRGTPFNIHRVIRYGIHGGSLLVILRHKDSGLPSHLSADEFLGEDAVTVRHWQDFAIKSQLKIKRMGDTVRDFVSKGKRVCGFGASAKMTVWLNAAGLTHKEILFVSDNSPLKPGTFIPGTQIPVIDQDEFLSEHPDVAFVGAWNFRDEILATQKKWRDRGGKFIFPTTDGIEIV